MTPDDHEFIDAYPLGPPLVKAAPANMDQAQYPYVKAAQDAVEAYQLGQLKPFMICEGVWEFTAGPIRAIVLDTRTRRSVTEILSSAQLEELRSWFTKPEAGNRLNVIATGSVLLPNKIPHGNPANPGRGDSFQRYPKDSRKVLDIINKAHEDNNEVRFLALSGDYHLSSAAEITKSGTTIGACIVAPSLYSSLPFIDSAPHTIPKKDVIQFDESTKWKLKQVDKESRGQRGNGLGIVDVKRESRNGKINYAVTFSAHVWMPYQQNAASEKKQITWELNL